MPARSRSRRSAADSSKNSRSRSGRSGSRSSRSDNLPPTPSLWRTLGPSFILLGLALGSGELILWPFLAANYGLGLLWGALLGISFQYFLNTETMRYSLAWGESVFVGFRRLSVFIPIWYVISTFIPWSLPGFSSASSQILTSLVPILPERLVAIGLLLLTGLLISAGRSLYRTMEVFQRSIILIGLPLMIALTAWLSTRADWVEVAWGLVGRGDGYWFFPEGLALAAFLGAFAFAGAGGNLNLAQSYYIREKGFGMGRYMDKITSIFRGGGKAAHLEGKTFAQTALNRRRWKAWWRLVNLEHFIVFWLLGFITIIVLAVLAKTTVFGQGLEQGLTFLFAEGAVIGQRTVPFLGTLFMLAAALMLFSTQVGVLESASRIISENVLLMFYRPDGAGRKSKVNASLWFYAALWGQISLGIVILLLGFEEPRFLLTLTAVLNAGAMMTAFPLLYWLNTRRLKPEYQPGTFRKLAMATAFAFFVFFLVITLQNFQV